MIVNFKDREISRGTHKLAWIPTSEMPANTLTLAQLPPPLTPSTPSKLELDQPLPLTPCYC
jgi:hypothetical protein